MDEKQKYREYDGLVGLTMLNLYSAAKDTQTMNFFGFDRKNKEHLFLLRVAYYVRDLYSYEIKIDNSCSIIEEFLLFYIPLTFLVAKH